MKKGPLGDIIFESDAEIPPTGHSLATTAFNRTGSWRNIEPFYRDLTPPCCDACPAGGDIVMWLALAAEERFDEAADVLRVANPFPAVCGRVCPHPCETSCLRQHHGGAISISRVERLLGDWAIERKRAVKADPKTGRKIAIIGAGPAGLSAAFQLGRAGHAVTVFEALPVLGGLLRTGIPSFRLPKKVLDAELDVFKVLPVRFETSKRLGKDFQVGDLKEFDAKLVAIGRYHSRELEIEGEDHAVSGIDLLRRVSLGEKVEIGERVAVIGGGSTAFDCARTLKRLGKNPVIVYRRSEKELPAFAHDVEEAAEEGIELILLSAPKKIVTENGSVRALQCVKTSLGKPDASGRRRAEVVSGSDFTLPVQAVVKAVGESLDPSAVDGFIKTGSNGITVNPNFDTGIFSVFACGDCAGGAGTVSDAIGRGRLAATAIEAFFYSQQASLARPICLMRGAEARVAEPATLNPAHIKPMPRPKEGRLPADRRLRSFDEVNAGLVREAVLAEARRCLSCGTCVQCHNCMNFCPDGAIQHTGAAYKIDYNYCKGCLICVQECPRGAMSSRDVTHE